MNPFRNDSLVWRLATTTLASILLLGCTQETERPVVAQPVRLFQLEGAGETSFRNFPGEVVASETARLSFEVPGRLITFPIQNGQLVKKGDLIGQLDTADFVAARDSAQAAYDAARSNFDRNELLQKQNVIPMAVLDRARQELDTANAALRTAVRALESTRLEAPFDGRISARIARELQNVRAQEQVAILEDISTMEVEINIPERDMMLGQQGLTVADAREILEAYVEFASIPDRRIDLTLKSFSTRANPVSRTFLVSFEFAPPADLNILPGMTGSVLVRRKAGEGVNAGRSSLHLVPVEALTTHLGSSTVWRLDPANMTVSAVPVTVTAIEGGAALVQSETLAKGDEIVVSGARFLAEGMPIRRMQPRTP
ncbi:MAG TPA: efflux RND transporter periplasmic adaptor subunit [Kiritimatiellia bacterium]|nr:efflux RND transporter periplasmic adaptor subunit [Kiritimatiellia bacterium]HMP34128.1 efflux RND transporter periplasmic adaptor subunit [Kiritimatiellia bacterium]